MGVVCGARSRSLSRSLSLSLSLTSTSSLTEGLTKPARDDEQLTAAFNVSGLALFSRASGAQVRRLEHVRGDPGGWRTSPEPRSRRAARSTYPHGPTSKRVLRRPYLGSEALCHAVVRSQTSWQAD